MALSVNDAQVPSIAGPSKLGPDVEVPPIFLSHSGQQKPFVEHLYNALHSANHSAFFDKHSLPKGSPFPPRIRQAALGCKLGVVVLSHDFLISKWPMLELEMLVLQRGPAAPVLPLFYKLCPEDLKNTTKLSEWRCVWKQKVGEDGADKWEQAVKALDSFNGEVYIERTSEDAYIKKVVRRMCTLVPIHASYDLSSIQGHERLAKEIARQFEHVGTRKSCGGTCMVGLHGVGGLGKTTMCKIMANFYNAQYLGRSCLIEFPTDGKDKLAIVQACRKALKKLTALNNEQLLNEADSFDQVVLLMREHLGQYDVFLAIDNVWESSLEEAKRILRVSFSANSKILLTSRSKEILKDLLRPLPGRNNSSVNPLPDLGGDEALQIFQDGAELSNLNSLVNGDQIGSVLGRCKFSGNYHPLALKALGQHVKRVCASDGLEKIDHLLSRILKETSNADLPKFENVLRLSYESLTDQKKNMFLDIVLLLALDVCMFNYATAGVEWLRSFFYVNLSLAVECFSMANAHSWLSALYGKDIPKTKISELIIELALDGVIQIEELDDSDEKIIRVHDLFVELAEREAARSSRFFTGRLNEVVEGIEWGSLERVVLTDCKSADFIEKLQQQKCEKLQVLYAVDVEVSSSIRLDFMMPSLRVLILRGWTLVSNAATGPAKKLLACIRPDASGVFKVGGFVQLQMLYVVGCCPFVERIAGLDALKNLKTLVVGDCDKLKNLDGLSGLLCLEVLCVERCAKLKKMPNLSALMCLERLDLWGIGSMEEVGRLSPALKDVFVVDCRALQKMPDLSGLTCLRGLYLLGCTSLQEVGGECLSSSLMSLGVYGCRSLRRFPRVDECVQMEALIARANGGIEISALTNLRRLHLWSLSDQREGLCIKEHRDLRSLSDQWKGLTLLESLRIISCDVMRIEGVGYLTSLQTLVVVACDALEEIGDLRGLHSLELLSVFACPRLKVVHGIMDISRHLKHLILHECPSLQENTLPDMSVLSSVRRVRICRCGKVGDFRK